MYKLPERRGGGRGNLGNARKKTFFFHEVFPKGRLPRKKTRKTVWSFNITILNCNICLPFKCGATCVPGKVAIGGDQSLVQLELCSSFTLPVFKSFKHPYSTSKCHSVQVHHQDNVYNDSWQTLVFLCELS